MKALFITTKTNDTFNHVRAWDSAFPKAERITFDHMGIRNDWQLVEAAERIKPEIVFYIGACDAPGNPKPEALRRIRAIAPLVNVVSDAADGPWHKWIMKYRDAGCFDVQAAIDGAIHSPVDIATLTPVDAGAWVGEVKRDIRCGFSGSPGGYSARGQIVYALEELGGLTVRKRGQDYAEHVAFVKRCRILFNVSLTGTEKAHHIKGRVLEAGWAGCALLEHADSPIAAWFPEGAWIPYESARHAASLIRELTDRQIEDAAHALSETVRERYTAGTIYGLMVDGARRSVDPPLAGSAA